MTPSQNVFSGKKVPRRPRKSRRCRPSRSSLALLRESLAELQYERGAIESELERVEAAIEAINNLEGGECLTLQFHDQSKDSEHVGPPKLKSE